MKNKETQIPITSTTLNKKIIIITFVLLVIGVICILVPTIIMIIGFNNETAGGHVILGIILGFGAGLLIAVGSYQFGLERKIKKIERIGK
ncbi:MAG: hypothetical protein LBD63_02820 [Mycoplasmataceae bacterium]|jgi:hypothetical protein|nr:hypothetical protein [Mycoplasmataceae bacterium]